ncbi:hypothetical protein AB2G29_10550 [Escherichia coli]
MLKLFSAFRKNKIWDFNGGIHPPEMKTQSNGTPLRQIPLAQRFVIPLKQHIGAEGELCVSVGDKVLRGTSRLPVVAAKCCLFTRPPRVPLRLLRPTLRLILQR